MEEEHRKVIQSNYVSLVETTDLDSMVTALYEKGVFSEQMIEPYKDTSVSQRERKMKLYRDITRRGPQAFSKLLEVLSENGYWDLVRYLDPNTSLRITRMPNSSTRVTSSSSNSDENTFVSISNRKHKSKPEHPPPPQQEPNKNNPTTSNVNTAANVNNNNDEPVPFVVKKSTKFVEDDESNDIKLYRTRGRKRGVLLVLSYVMFKNDIETYRNGVDVDCNNLKHLFSEMGFSVLAYRDLTLKETILTLESLKEVLLDMESVFVVVSSHGYERSRTSDTDVRCSDGNLISLYQIIEYFNNNNLPHLAHIPKVFIFQICRGSNFEFSYAEGESTRTDGTPFPAGGAGAAGEGTRRAALRSPLRPKSEAALYSNILIAHSTLPGFVSRRDDKLGSWYIQALCKVFAERAHDTHVDKLFTFVDKHLQEQFRIQTSSVDRWGFNKRLYLHPGLYE